MSLSYGKFPNFRKNSRNLRNIILAKIKLFLKILFTGLLKEGTTSFFIKDSLGNAITLLI